MAMIRTETENGEKLARRIVYLAWLACGGPAGMGFLQDRGVLDEEEVWKHAYARTDYPGGRRFGADPDDPNNPRYVYCDYVCGRMMKFSVRWGDTWVETPDNEPRPDYEAWCRRYKTYRELIDAAVASL